MEAGIMYDVSLYSADGWKRLGDRVRSRRVVLGLTQEDLAEAAGTAPGTIRSLEQGKRSRMLTLPKVCRALGWTPESAEAILLGGEPSEATAAEPPPGEEFLRFEKPKHLSDEEWAEFAEQWDQITQKMISDFEWHLRMRGDH